MNKIIGAYRNGNYDVVIFEDGTKIRHNDIEPLPGQLPDEVFRADFPESMDVSITHRCDAGCAMCYAGCTMSGNNGDILNAKWLNSIHPYTEMAIGGGNVFLHPDLIPFLEILKEKKVFANITVNQKHFIKHFTQIKSLCEKELVKGVGVSVFEPTEELMSLMNSIPHGVAHCILGVVDIETLKKMYDHDIRLLLLGYKTTGRGSAYSFDHYEEINLKIDAVDKSLKELVNHFKVVSFDNKALKQLHVREIMSEDEWNRFYMGDDGIDGKTTSATMFIDMVDNTFAINSMTPYGLYIQDDDTVDTMFKALKGER